MKWLVENCLEPDVDSRLTAELILKLGFLKTLRCPPPIQQRNAIETGGEGSLQSVLGDIDELGRVNVSQIEFSRNAMISNLGQLNDIASIVSDEMPPLEQVSSVDEEPHLSSDRQYRRPGIASFLKSISCLIALFSCIFTIVASLRLFAFINDFSFPLTPPDSYNCVTVNNATLCRDQFIRINMPLFASLSINVLDVYIVALMTTKVNYSYRREPLARFIYHIVEILMLLSSLCCILASIISERIVMTNIPCLDCFDFRIAAGVFTFVSLLCSILRLCNERFPPQHQIDIPVIDAASQHLSIYKFGCLKRCGCTAFALKCIMGALTLFNQQYVIANYALNADYSLQNQDTGNSSIMISMSVTLPVLIIHGLLTAIFLPNSEYYQSLSGMKRIAAFYICEMFLLIGSILVGLFMSPVAFTISCLQLEFWILDMALHNFKHCCHRCFCCCCYCCEESADEESQTHEYALVA